jgi:hypothetical protein
MSHYLQPVFDKIIRLDNDQRQHPDDVIQDFLDEFPLSSVRHYYSVMLETCLTTDDDTFDADLRQDLVFFCQHSEELIEALSIKLGKVTTPLLEEEPDEEGGEGRGEITIKIEMRGNVDDNHKE